MSKCYKKPFLTKVIAKIDFTAKYSLPLKGLTKEISDEILKLFPILEPRNVIAKQVKITSKGVLNEIHEKQVHLFFHGKSREKTLTITPDFLYIELMKYDTYEKLKNEFFKILDLLYEKENFSIRRFGLRYINNINLDEGSPLNWDGYINSKLLYHLKILKDNKIISRAFSNLIQQYDDGMMLNFQYGIYNKDFPSRVKEKIYILDFDAFYEGLIYKDDVKNNFSNAHSRIEKLFENVITDKLREKMGDVDEKGK